MKKCMILFLFIYVMNCQTQITANLKDFPTKYLQQFNIQAQHPDKFITELINTYSEQSLTAFHQQVNNLKNPPLSAEDVLNSLNKCGL